MCMLRAGIVFWQLPCVSVRTKPWKLLFWNWRNLVGICPMTNARSGSKLVTFDRNLWHWGLFSYFSIHNGFTWQLQVWRYIFRISRSPSSFQVMGLISRSWSQNSSSMQVCTPLGHSLFSAVVFTLSHFLPHIGNNKKHFIPEVARQLYSSRYN